MRVVSFEQAQQYINQLDLGYLIDTMCAESYSLPRWTRDDAEKCCQLYKNFLLLQKKHLPTPLVPTRQIDEFWHNHILYTKAYFTDCENIFGHYLHHEPASADESADALISDFLHTKNLYLAEFGTQL